MFGLFREYLCVPVHFQPIHFVSSTSSYFNNPVSSVAFCNSKKDTLIPFKNAPHHTQRNSQNYTCHKIQMYVINIITVTDV